MILDTIVEDKKIRLREEKDKLPLEYMRDKAYSVLKDKSRDTTLFYHNLAKDGISIIGEFKIHCVVARIVVTGEIGNTSAGTSGGKYHHSSSAVILHHLIVNCHVGNSGAIDSHWSSEGDV